MKSLIIKYPRNRITDILLSLLCFFVIILIIQYDSGSRTVPVISGTNDVIEFLKSNSIEVNGNEPLVEEIFIDASRKQVFEDYNKIQKEQGYDLTQYIGRKVSRYTFEVENSEGCPLYAAVFVYNGKIIAADIHSASLDGFIRGVKNNSAENQVG